LTRFGPGGVCRNLVLHFGRRLLKGSSFTSLDDLRQRVLAFIEYFNRVLSKPIRWTYTGRPLQA